LLVKETLDKPVMPFICKNIGENRAARVYPDNAAAGFSRYALNWRKTQQVSTAAACGLAYDGLAVEKRKAKYS